MCVCASTISGAFYGLLECEFYCVFCIIYISILIFRDYMFGVWSTWNAHVLYFHSIRRADKCDSLTCCECHSLKCSLHVPSIAIAFYILFSLDIVVLASRCCHSTSVFVYKCQV